MKTYQAVFRADSALTVLPSAQTLFGAICQILADTQGEQALMEYLDSFEEKPVMIHSAMMPENLFPMPKRNIFSLEFINEAIYSTCNSTKLAAMAEYKKYKKIQYVSLGVFKTYILTGKLQQLQKDLLTKSDKFALLDSGILRFKEETTDYKQKSVLQTRNGKRGLSTKKDLFYISTIYPDENQRFSMFIKTDWPKEKIEELLMQFELFGIGARRTIGMNFFTLIDVKEVHMKNTGPLQYLLSDCIPDESIDLERSSYALHSIVYRGSKSYNGGYFTGRYTSLCAGSLISSSRDTGWLGKNDIDDSQGQKVWHYGMGFVF